MRSRSFSVVVMVGLLVLGVGPGRAFAGGDQGTTPEYWDQEAARYRRYAVEYQTKADVYTAKADELQANGDPLFEEYRAKAAEALAMVAYKRERAAEFQAKADALRGGRDGIGNKPNEGEERRLEKPKEDPVAKARAKAKEAAREAEAREKEQAHALELKRYVDDLKVELEVRKVKTRTRCERLNKVRRVTAFKQEKTLNALETLKARLEAAEQGNKVEEAAGIRKAIDAMNRRTARTIARQAKDARTCTEQSAPTSTVGP
ncbi:MAG: hypothetical protein WA797_05060 [Acidimicrobiales bacterium]